MLNVNLKADLLFVNVPEDTLETLTPIVFVIPVEQILAVISLKITNRSSLNAKNISNLGANAICENNGNAAICKCPPEHVGDPYVSCTFDPCALNPCGPNTECNVSGQRSVCRCIRGYTGSPESRSGCLADPCSVNDICGQNAECRNEGGRPVCQCLSGHKGDPYTGCVRGDCISNSECRDNQACQDYKCVDPRQLSCGSGADCQVNNHVAICRCPRGFTGDPFQVKIFFEG